MVLSYRQVVHAYPSGGGDYEVAMKNHGQFAALVVASALLTDYVLTVAVSVSSGTDNIISAFPSLNQHRVLIAVGLVALLAAANLRGVRESGKTFAVPTYLFATGIMVMIVTGLIRQFFGTPIVAESAHYGITADPAHTNLDRAGAAVLRAAGVRLGHHRADRGRGGRQRRAGVQAAEEPQRRHHAGCCSAASPPPCSPASRRWPCSRTCGTSTRCTPATCRASRTARPQPQRTVIAQLAAATFGGDHSIGFFYIQAATALVLVLAANTAFNGFPLLGSVLAQDRFLPRQLHTRGDKLVYSNGILLLAGFACLLIFAFDADVTRLIQLYIIGVFTSFSIGQWGMVRHWNREMRIERDPQVAPADAPLADHQHRRRLADQRRAGDHRDHQVHPRRLAGARGDADPVRADEGDQPALLERRPAAGARQRRAHAAQQGARRSCWSPRCTSRRCGPWPSPGPPGPTRSPR